MGFLRLADIFEVLRGLDTVFFDLGFKKRIVVGCLLVGWVELQ